MSVNTCINIQERLPDGEAEIAHMQVNDCEDNQHDLHESSGHSETDTVCEQEVSIKFTIIIMLSKVI